VIPDLPYVACVIGFVLLLTIILDRLLLRPMNAVINAREGATQAARALAESSRIRAEQASSELEARTRQARSELYRQMDDKRRVALERRADVLGSTRREVEQLMHEAAARVQAQVSAARAQLDRDADLMAGTIVERVLGRQVS
jgi:F0F1-type ATP synthase membrane subunit b/b'